MTKNKLLPIIILFLFIFQFVIGTVDCLSLLDKSYTVKSDIYSIKIENGYMVWSPDKMKQIIQIETIKKYNSSDVVALLHKDYCSMYVEWWLHNIGYYITKPFCFIERINFVNSRFKDVDLEESI